MFTAILRPIRIQMLNSEAGYGTGFDEFQAGRVMGGALVFGERLLTTDT
jgi:hypothetical protein